MSWRTSKSVLAIRHVGRLVGVNAFVGKLIQRGYEKRFDDYLARGIRLGDIVWDVGANVGHYVVQFGKRVGPTGRVLAFEPSRDNFARLQRACEGLGNVDLHNVALGDKAGRLPFAQGTDELGATSRVVEKGEAAEFVEVAVGDALIDRGFAFPTVVKIDVEGYEYEVLGGLSRHLGDRRLRLIGIEVHFGILSERGLGDTPRRIEELLASSGFKVRWADASRIVGARA